MNVEVCEMCRPDTHAFFPDETPILRTFDKISIFEIKKHNKRPVDEFRPYLDQVSAMDTDNLLFQ